MTGTRLRLRKRMLPGVLGALLGLQAAPAAATWSIVAVDTVTQEVVIGSATCVTSIDLKALSPVVLVGWGGAAVQSQADTTGERRGIIWAEFLDGTPSDEILTILEQLPASPFHQYGIADTDGHAATFTGSSNGAHASGVTGAFDHVHYAIQGNLLTGSPVVTMAESALVGTPTDLPGRLMAAMEAARAMGGDGRCSCPGDPTGCGSPPPTFEKSAHVGFLLGARFGDGDDPECTAQGCADGDYFLDFNIAFQPSGAEDPVLQLQPLFEGWRSGLVGRPDAVASTVSFTRVTGGFLLALSLIDWQGVPLAAGVDQVTVEHAPESAQSTTIGPVIDRGDGTYEVMLSWAGAGGVDIFLINVDDGVRPVIIPPRRATLDPSAIFSDGFESGDSSAWTLQVP